MSEQWQEVGDRVYTRRHRSYDLNIGLVVGDDRCLVIDTRMSYPEARDLIEAIRTITDRPWTVVNTHAHFDHHFGNALFLPADIWAHAGCAEMISAYGEVQKKSVMRESPEVAEVEITPPSRTFTGGATLDLGGGRVDLLHLGRGHTDHDIVVHVPDAGVIFAGDLVEEGAPPSFGDAFPLEWADTLQRIIDLSGEVVVPGHGAVVDKEFVRRQRAEHLLTVELITGGGDLTEIPFPGEFAKEAVERTRRQLAGLPPYDSPEDRLAELNRNG